MRSIAAAGELSVRVRAYPFYTFDDQWSVALDAPADGDEWFRLVGYKLVADGSNQGRTGLLRDPYLGSDSHGLAYCTVDEMERLAAFWADKGWQIAVHGNGDAAIDAILTMFERLAASGVDVPGLRPRIEHCSILHDDQIDRMVALGVSPSFLINHVHDWGVAFRDRILGAERANLLDRCASAEAAGCRYTIHSTSPSANPTLFT